MGENSKQPGRSIGRRTYLRGAGVAGLVGTSALAGCTGGGEDGGGGSDGTNTGNGDTSGAVTNGSQTETLTIAYSPGQMNNLVYNHMAEETDILSNKMDEAGYEIEVERTHDGPTLYVSGHVEFMTASPAELMNMGAEQGVESVWFGSPNLMAVSYQAKADSQYDPRNSGGARESLDLLAESGDPFSFFGWDSGTVPMLKMLLAEWGYTFSQEESSFNAQPTGPETMGPVLVNDRAGLATATPQFTGVLQYMIPELQIYEVFNFLDDEILSAIGMETSPSFAAFAARKVSWEEKQDGFVALYEAFDESLGWLHENLRDIREREDLTEIMEMEDRTQAQWRLDWGVGADMGELWGEEYSTYQHLGEFRDTAEITDEMLAADEQFIEQAVQLGAAPENPWDYLQVEQLG